MECTNPKYITNRTLHYTLFQPLRMKVPCGKCEACLKSQRDDWFIRCVYEWKSTGCRTGFFYTLTFNNEHLPRYYGLPCFSKELVQKFLKRLRFRLDKLHIKLKYLLVCEYGELRGRAHHHVFFNLSREVNPYWFFRFVQDSWVDGKGDSLGFVKPGDNVGLIDSYQGISYVTKYITKDFAHLDTVLPRFAPWIFKRYYDLYNYVCSRYHIMPQCSFKMNSDYSFSRQIFGKCSDEDLMFVQKFLTKMRREINKVVPFHLQSQGLGSNIIDCPTLSHGMIPHVDSKGIRYYKIPRYFKRKLWYDCIENERDGKRTKFVLNDAGKNHILDKLDDTIATEKHKLEYVTLNSNLSKIDSSIVFFLKEKGYGFSDVRDLVSYIGHLSLNLDVLALYSAVFRGRYNIYGNIELNGDFLLNHYKEFVTDTLYEVSRYDFGAICKDRTLLDRLEYSLFNYHPFFQVYEENLRLLEMIYSYHNENASAASASLERKERKARQFYKLIV